MIKYVFSLYLTLRLHILQNINLFTYWKVVLVKLCKQGAALERGLLIIVIIILVIVIVIVVLNLITNCGSRQALQTRCRPGKRVAYHRHHHLGYRHCHRCPKLNHKLWFSSSSANKVPPWKEGCYIIVYHHRNFFLN